MVSDGIVSTDHTGAKSLTLSLYGSHVPGSSATASHPSASAVRTSVPRFPGSWIPSSARSLVIRPRFRQRADADDRRHGELSHGVDPVHRLEPGGLLEDVLGGADDPARGHAGRHVRVLREEERQGAPDAIDAGDSTANLREDPRAGDDDGAALLAVAAVAHELGEVFDRRVVGARDVLLASRGGCDEPDAAAPHAVPRLSRTIEWS